MNFYKLSFSASGTLSQIPDSQKIFGALCMIIKSTKGEDKLKEYFHSLESDPFLIHSSMMIDGTMPMIKESLFDITEVNRTVRTQSPEKQLEVLSRFKTYKRIRCVSDRVFQTYILTDEIDRLKADLLNGEQLIIKDNCLCFEDEIESLTSASLSFYRVRMDVMNEESDEGRLFRDSVIYYPENTSFNIYVKTTLNKETVSDLFSYLDYFSAGNKGSIGRNLYKLEKVEELNLHGTSNQKMILSRYIPNADEFNAEESSYELLTANHIANPDNRGTVYTRKISYLSEGSYIHFNEDKEYYGRVISYQAGEQTQYHYGIGFVV